MLDPRIHTALNKEAIRQENTIELIASENYTSDAVMDLCGSILTNKYAEALPGRRF
jgi:glycine hydroxymethyltransferase